MDIVALTYTSRAAPGLTVRDVDLIHRAALTYNPLDGISGLLVYNGLGFMQVIEGAESAIDDLIKRICADVRHRDVEIRDRRARAQRSFTHWDMYRIDVDPSFDRGLADVEEAVLKMIDAPMRKVVVDALSAISTPALRQAPTKA